MPGRPPLGSSAFACSPWDGLADPSLRADLNGTAERDFLNGRAAGSDDKLRARIWELEAALATARKRIAELEARLAQRGVTVSKDLHRAIVKALHPDLTTDPQDKARRDVLSQEFNALPIDVIAPETNAQRARAGRVRACATEGRAVCARPGEIRGTVAPWQGGLGAPPTQVDEKTNA